MKNFNDNTKTVTVIENAYSADLEKVTRAINSSIDFYLCRDPFIPINSIQAGNIYFLRKLLKCLSWESSRLYLKKDKGRILCTIPDNDYGLVIAFYDSLESTIWDIGLSPGHREDKAMKKMVSVLSLLKSPFKEDLRQTRRSRYAS